MLVIPSYSLTKAHTATVVADQVLEDFEGIAAGRITVEAGDLDLLDALSDQLRPDRDFSPLPRLRVPEFRADLSSVASALAKERDAAAAAGRKPGEFVGFATQCPKCGIGYYLADAVVDRHRGTGEGRGSKSIVLGERHRWSKSATWVFDEAHYERRVVTYRMLLALLQSH